jgi:hypothetical protein
MHRGETAKNHETWIQKSGYKRAGKLQLKNLSATIQSTTLTDKIFKCTHLLSFLPYDHKVMSSSPENNLLYK